jgi:hypothetical protein
MRYLTSDQDDHSAGFASRAAGETMVSKGATSRSDFASAEELIVYVIDDDAEMRAALGSLFRSVDLQVKLFRSALNCFKGASPTCQAAWCSTSDFRA